MMLGTHRNAWRVPANNVRTGDVKTRMISRDLWPASLAESTNSRLNKKSYLRKVTRYGTIHYSLMGSFKLMVMLVILNRLNGLQKKKKRGRKKDGREGGRERKRCMKLSKNTFY